MFFGKNCLNFQETSLNRFYPHPFGQTADN